MSNAFKSALKYLISLGLGILLLWLVFKDEDLKEMAARLMKADFRFVILSLLIAIMSHVSRAYRWNLLIEPLGYKTRLSGSFLAVMVGYLANLALPRMGEVTRCAILQKSDNIPLNASFGTVITERIFDLITLILVLGFTFLLEFDRLNAFLLEIISGKFGSFNPGMTAIYVAAGFTIIVCFLLWLFIKLYKEQIKASRPFISVKNFSKGMAEGVLSIKKLKRKKAFIFHTVFIWACYYFMSYVIFFALPATSELGFSAGFTVLVMGGLGMAAPVQGGIGAFHWIIMNSLALYGLSIAEGRDYATIVHSSQMIMITVTGLTCLLISILSKKRNINMHLA